MDTDKADDAVDVTFVGCGDAFGSGGRVNTCFHVGGGSARFLIDCGASSLIALKKLGLDPNAIDTILITHFHADHFGGLPFLLLDARFFSKRTRPLAIAGPEGTRDALHRWMELSFPGSAATRFAFDLQVIELPPGVTHNLGPLRVTPFRVQHGPVEGPFYAYRISFEGRVIAYTGDTEWTEALVDVGRDADLFIAEAYFRDRPVKLHLDLATLESHLPEIRPKRLVLTHMSDDMLGQIGGLSYEVAEDGLVLRL